MTEVRIGVTQVPKELVVEVADAPDAVEKQVTEAVGDPNGLLWLTDTKGKRVGVTVAKLAYVEIDPEVGARSVGFSR